MISLGKDLQKILQRVQPGFAYQLLALQIDIQLDLTQKQHKIGTITRLIQLYMVNAAVQSLQSKCDKRYKYFNTKIQNLMKKKHIVQELHKASTGRNADKNALQEVLKAEIGQRRNQLDFQMLLNKEQFDARKIRQIMKLADTKMKTFQQNIQSNLKKQDDILEQRRRIRKMKSDAGSVSKFDKQYRKFQSPNSKFVMKSQKELDDYFAIDNDIKNSRKNTKNRGGSIEKITQNQNSNKANNISKLKAFVI